MIILVLQCVELTFESCSDIMPNVDSCGRGGIGIRARLRGVSSNGYGFKSRRPHFDLPDSLRENREFFFYHGTLHVVIAKKKGIQR